VSTPPFMPARSQRNRACGCFAYSFDTHPHCSRHSVPGDCQFYKKDFELAVVRCLHCVTWSDTQWTQLRRPARPYASRNMPKVKKSKVADSPKESVPSPSRSE
jgi:hypothetical protein